MKKKCSIAVLMLATLFGLLAIGENNSEKQQIFINEVRSWDADVTRDGYYGSDYIELYNASEEGVSLEGWYVSDDATDLTKSQLHEIFVDAKGFVLLYANGKGDSGDSLNFKIDPMGEKIFLSNPEGILVDSVYVPEQEFGTVYARKTDGAKEWAVMKATTDYSNREGEILPVRNLSAPIFSHESGFYEDAFTLTIEAKKGENIYYTLDGSEPTEESNVYTDGICIYDKSEESNILHSVRNVMRDWETYEPSTKPVEKAVIVRAVAMDGSRRASEVITKTYFVNLEEYEGKNIVSLVADFDEMFGGEGIFVTGTNYEKGESPIPNFFQSGRRWEIQGNMEIIKEGDCVLNQKVGIRTQGASTREAPKKKMSIFSREEYSGNTYFEGWELGSKRTHSTYTNHSISNIVFPELLEDRSLGLQNAENCIVFLNGEYWYDTYLLEKYNKHYLAEKYGVNQDNVIIIKDQSETEGPEDSYIYYQQLRDFALNSDFSNRQQYEAFCQKVDMQSYIDFMCANIYLCNMDMSETKNLVLWRTIEDEGTEIGDTRWRWMIYDMDCLEWVNQSYYGADSRAEINTFAETMQFTGVAINEQILFSSLKSNEVYRKQFVTTFLDMANVNFSLENIEKVFAKWSKEPEEEFGDFFEKRFDYIVPYMAEEFYLTGTLENLTLQVNDVQGGKILLNTTEPDMSKGSWTGKYYTDYPIKITAVPEDGYRFVRWEGNVSSENETLEVDIIHGGVIQQAIFEKETN